MMIKKVFLKKVNSIKIKTTFYYIIMIVFMSIISIYSLSITNKYKEQIDSLFARNLILNNLSNQLTLVDKELVMYLSTKNSTNLNNYMRNADELQNIAGKLSNQVVNYTEEELMFKDIENMVNSYIAQTEKAVYEKRKTDIAAYTKTYNDLLNTMSYISDYISELNNRQLYRNASNYTYMSKQILMANVFNLGLIIDLIFLSIILVYRMSNNMIKPLIKLSHSAEDISKGNFETKEVIVQTNDEIEILSNAFNKMKKSIHAYIEELKEKASMEVKIKDQEMENFKMQSLLDKARLYALQSQMDPHFLFNTINAAVQLSVMEGADNTGEFLERMARVFRYNIKQIDSEVTISQEIENIKDYYELLNVRFGDLIEFHFEIDESGLEFKMPPLIIQPIVENAYIHGLSKKEEGGNICIKVINKLAETEIIVEDDGIGMPEETIDLILNIDNIKTPKNEFKYKSTKESPQIGMNNVINRLELFFKEKNLVKISSTQGIGTKVIISIPHSKGD